MAEAITPVAIAPQDELTVRLTPLVAGRRATKVMLAIVHRLGAAPIVGAHPFAVLPMVRCALVGAPTRVIAGLRKSRTGRADDKRRRRDSKHKSLHDDLSNPGIGDVISPFQS
ncbi:MAG: hypothetical protein WDM85_10575 [Caulobacteraceae bacterium]